MGFGRRARELLVEGGIDVEYHEGDNGHWIEPGQAAQAAGWLATTLGRG